MKILALGGAGKICREAVLDLAEFGDFEQITIADYNLGEAVEVVQMIGKSNVDCKKIDVKDRETTIEIMRNYDLVMDGTTISLNALSTACIALAGCHGINLNGFGEEYKFQEIFQKNNKVMVPGFGMTPGTTNMMAVYACDQMESVESVRISHGAFRPIAFSDAIAETTIFEYDPNLKIRVVYENGQMMQVAPFSRPREIELPEPYGKQTQYIIPHSETFTLKEYLENKGVNLIEVRGTWPPANMKLLKALHEWDFLKNDKIMVHGNEIGIMDAIAKYLLQSPLGRETEIYGYALHVEVIGMKNGQKTCHILTHTHPASDGSIPGWEKLRAYTRNVGIPFAVGVHLIHQGKFKGTGVVTPEFVFDPLHVFEELKRREIYIHEKEFQVKDY